MADIYEPPRTLEPPAASTIPAARPRQGFGLALLVFLLLAFIGLGLGWMHWQERKRGDELGALLEALQTAQRRAVADSAALRSRLEAAETATAALAGAQQGDRRRLQLTLAEHLLLTGNERLQLAHDPAAAQLALELADARLALLNDPRLFKLRETIASERAALAKVPRVDRSGAAVALSALIDSAAQLPLAAQVPARFQAATDEETPPAVAVAGEGWWNQAWARMREALGAMFSVRHARGAPPRLLAPEAEQQVYQILQLRLEAVRVALLAGEQPALGQTAQSAAAWLRQYFRSDDSGVKAALDQLKRVGDLPLNAPLPDISASLGLLRAELGAATP